MKTFKLEANYHLRNDYMKYFHLCWPGFIFTTTEVLSFLIPHVFSRICMFSFVLCPSLVSVVVIIMTKGNLGKERIYFSLKIIVHLLWKPEQELRASLEAESTVECCSLTRSQAHFKLCLL